MGFKVCYSNAAITDAAGFGKVAHLPFVMDSRPGYHRLGSQYLIDRGLGAWSPNTHGQGPKSSKPSKKTIKSYAHWLANFLEWAGVRGVPLEHCEYAEHIQGRYQAEMLKGTWSASGHGLQPSTINPRVQQACDFLTWMSDKGLRSPLSVPTEKVKISAGSAINAVGHRGMEVRRRIGKFRQNKRRLRMPTENESSRWLSSVYATHGLTLGLACETIVLTGLRLEEASSLRVDTLPEERRNWHLSNPDAPRAEQQVC